MEKMSLNTSGTTGTIGNRDLLSRLLTVMERVYSYFYNNGMPTGGLYDMAFVNVAVSLARCAVERNDPKAERIVSDMEAINFIVYGDVNMRATNPEDSKTKKRFAEEVVIPLHAAYLRNKEVQDLYPSVEGMFTFIIKEWCEK